MKRFIATLSFAALATAALADNGKPFEQLDLDRALPTIPEKSGQMRSQVADSGTTRSDVEVATEEGGESPWANDVHFIAPPL
jgi:hypothetical protein